MSGRFSREIEEYLAEALPLQDVLVLGMVPPPRGLGGPLVSQIPNVLAIFWLDVSKRPELGDLGRVHMAEGNGEAVYTWAYIGEEREDCLFALTIALHKPVRETVRFAIPVGEWAGVLEVISTTGIFSILG